MCSSARTALALLLLAFTTTSAFADAPVNVHVVIEPTSTGATARFSFERPVQSFRLSYVADEIRDRTWKIATPDIVREGTLITAAGASFQAFSVDIEAFNEPTNATYPNVFRVGADGIAFYAGYFVGVEPDFATTIEVAPADGHVVEGLPVGGNLWRVDPAFHRNAAHRYVYVGPRAYVSESRRARFVLPPGPAPALIVRIRANVDGAIEFYARKVGRSPPAKPLIILAANAESERSGSQGDTTSGPTVALRLFGKRWQAFDTKSDAFDHFIAHEAAHFWNADTFHAAEGSPAWLWEGSAEVWALAARMAVMKRLTPKGRRDHIEDALNECATSLLDDPLTGHRSGMTYVCGETLYWLADAAEKKRTRGRGDIFSIWRRLFDAAENNGGVYTMQDILTFAAPSGETKKAFALFLGDSGSERWQTLPDLLKPFGIKVAAEPPADETLRTIAIMHILSLSCAGQFGAWHENDHLKLDTGDRCGPLSGDPEIDTLNGRSLYSDAPAAFAAAKAACDAGGDITFTRAGKPEKWTAPCTKPLPSAPPKFRIVSTP